MKEAVLYQTDSLFLREVVLELEKQEIPYRLTDERSADDGSVLFVILDQLLEEELSPFYRKAPGQRRSILPPSSAGHTACGSSVPSGRHRGLHGLPAAEI